MFGSDCGSIYFWDHERESQPPTEDNVWFIADSFDEFFNGLFLIEDEA